jgi:anti-sigma factor RsiW
MSVFIGEVVAMRCKTVAEKLDAYVLGELRTGRQKRIERHLARCPRCGAAAADLRRMLGLFARAAAPPAPQGLAARVSAAARRRMSAPAPAPALTPRTWWRTVPWPQRVAAAAALLLGLTAGTLIARSAWRAPDAALTRESDPLDEYQLDALTEVPPGSLADEFLVLVASDPREGV